jgi:type III secretion protein C
MKKFVFSDFLLKKYWFIALALQATICLPEVQASPQKSQQTNAQVNKSAPLSTKNPIKTLVRKDAALVAQAFEAPPEDVIKDLPSTPQSNFPPNIPSNPSDEEFSLPMQNGQLQLPPNGSLPPNDHPSPLNNNLQLPPNDHVQLPPNGNLPSAEPIVPDLSNPALNAPPAQTPIAPTENAQETASAVREISINFNNVAMIEFIRFISRITGKNFIFDDADLQFNVTIISEEPTSIGNLMAALLQELKIRDLSLIEQGNNLIIHRNANVRAPGSIVAEGVPVSPYANEIVTRVFRLNTLDPIKASEILRPLLSQTALIEVLRDSNNLIITDLVANVDKIAQLISSLDAPNSGMTIGQYVVRNAFVDSLAVLGERILQPIAQGNPFVFVPHPASNSIFIVSNSFIVERALAILESLDNNEGRTRIFTLDKLRLQEEQQQQAAAAAAESGSSQSGVNGGLTSGGTTPPGLLEGEFVPGGISSAPRWTRDLPAGHIERTVFFIHKLKYRRGGQIEIALRKIAESLILAGTTNADLISAINSIQWIDSTNSLIFTGTGAALERIRDLVEEIDLPLRQVFIEMLVLDVTLSDSLRYGVEWGTAFGGGSTVGAQAFLTSPSSALLSALDSARNVVDPTNLINPARPIGPDSTRLARTEGYSLGVVGKHLTHDGTRFNSIGALVTAIHNDQHSKIVLNPKIITEDNHTAEIFVGETTRYKTQSISNDIGSVITNNFQFLDVGATLRVTPLIGANDVVTLDIIQEITRVNPLANSTPSSSADDFNLIPVLSKNRTLTKAHVPNGFFVVISGMIDDTKTRTIRRIPCLGGLPLIGGGNKHQGKFEDKRNLMIFIRPLIIDTDDEYEYLTKRQQDLYREKEKFPRFWNYEVDEALDFLNVKPTEPNEIGCTVK